MAGRPKIYIAGPGVFLPNAAEIGRRKVELCTDFGFDGLLPSEDVPSDPCPAGTRVDRLVYRRNMALIDDADCGILDLTPFRGHGADVGTAFELGVLTGLGKPCFAYSNESTSLLARLHRDRVTTYDEARDLWVDGFGMTIEDFGNADNLMLDNCLAEQGRPVLRLSIPPEDKFTAIEGFVACLELARGYFSTRQTFRPAPRRMPD